MAFINTTGLIGQVLNYLTINITGHEVLTYLMLIMVLIGVCLMFKMPLELTLPVVFPVLIVLGLYATNLFYVLGVAMLYLAIIIGKTILFK